MKKKLRIAIRKFKRNMRKIFPVSSKKGKKKSPIPLLAGSVLVVAAGYLFLRFGLDGVMSFPKSPVVETDSQEDLVTEFSASGFVGSKGDNTAEWLYSSDTLQFEEVWTKLVENENATCASMKKKDRAAWEAEIMNSFQWEEYPSTITKADAVTLGVYCGFTESQVKDLLFGTPYASSGREQLEN